MSDSVPQPDAAQPAAQPAAKPDAAKPDAAKPDAAQPAAVRPAAKPAIKVGGLSPAAQKLQNLRDKAAHAKTGAKPAPGASAASFKAKSLAGTRKTSFQRKAV